MGHAPRFALLRRARTLRSGTLDARGTICASEVFVFSIRRRASPMRRRELRLDGGHPVACDVDSAMVHASCAGIPRRTATAAYSAPETRNEAGTDEKGA